VAAIKQDVAVLGGGPAGCTTALALVRRGYSTVIIERSEYESPRLGESLSPAIRKPLAVLGVWDRFLSDSHSHSFGIHSAWGQDHLYINDFIFDPYGPGWHVDRARFDAMLARAAEDAGARVYRGVHSISTVENSDDWRVEITSSESRTLHARLLVDATGRTAWLAHREGARRVNYDHLVGVAAFFSPCSPDHHICHNTLIEAAEEGWWYSVPLPNSNVIAIYMTDADLYAKGSKTRAHYWEEKLAQTVHTRLRVNSLVMASVPFVVAANSSRIARVTGDKWLAVGDAAMTFDPLSGQGISKALQSGMHAAQAIHARFSGSDSAWDDYEDEILDKSKNYMLRRNEYYRRENRWPLSPFWSRRQSAGWAFAHSARG